MTSQQRSDMSAVSSDRMSLAYIKNRTTQSLFELEIKRLEHEKKSELKMLHMEQQRFKSKFVKPDITSSSFLTVPEVKMYETHYPGFCYRRNGEQKSPFPEEVKSSLGFESIRPLLFTDGEVDVEKVLCLHMVAVHRTDSLMFPSKYLKEYVGPRENTPLERLIERSKKRPFGLDERLERMPLYIVELNESTSSNFQNAEKHSDHRLKSRLLVNEQIMEVLKTVLKALENANPEKMRQLIATAKDVNQLREVFRGRDVQDFIKSLNHHSLITSSESFTLSQQLKLRPTNITIKTTTGSLENLLEHIRKYALHPPTPTRWSQQLFVESPDMNPGEEEKILSKTEKAEKLVKLVDRKKLGSRENLGKSVEDLKGVGGKDAEAAGTSRNVDVEEDKTEKKRVRGKKTVGKKKSSDAIALEDEDKDPDQSAEGSICLDPSHSSNEPKDKKTKTSAESEAIKVHLKQTTCPACMERWKQPLPSPKTPRIVRTKTDDQQLRTNSHNRISMLINKEMYQLNAYDRRYSDENKHRRTCTLKASNSSLKVEVEEGVNLSSIALAKIDQEIREKETQKKLEKFLNESL